MKIGFLKIKGSDTVRKIFFYDEIDEISVNVKFFTFDLDENGNKKVLINSDSLVYLEYWEYTEKK